MSTINIKIGDIDTTWEIWETNAPREYDGFGTFTIYEFEGTRTVLIRCEHRDWQATRYASGINWLRPSAFDTEIVAKHLWNQLIGKTEK
jgi:hypothetical protein